MHNPKQYIRPETLDEAVAALTSHAGAYPLVGGGLALGTLDIPYEAVVDLSRVPGLSAIEVEGETVVLGGAAMLAAVVAHDAVSIALKRSITRTLPMNIRNNTSVMESLTVNRLPVEWLTTLVAVDATVTRLLPDGTEDIASMVDAIPVAGVQNGIDLREGVITAVRVPLFDEHTALGTAQVARTPAAEPIVNACVRLQLDEAGTVTEAFAVLGGVSSDSELQAMPLSGLVGEPLTPEAIEAQAAQISDMVDPVSDFRGSTVYRSQMAVVVTRRAVEDALAQLNAQKQ
ncbi:MAG: FAD binding domain-containing protein [Chloroflexota bacterium]